MRTRLPFVIVVAYLWVGAGPTAFAGQSPQVETKTTQAPSGIQLLDGYKHRSLPGLDTTNGVIWKDGGPRIDYVIGIAGPQATAYRQTHKGIWRTSVKVRDMAFDFVLDTDQDVLVATIGGYGTFTATGVRSRQDVSEVMLIIMTYDMSKGR